MPDTPASVKPVIEKVDSTTSKTWWWRVRAVNGEILSYSENYSSKWSRNRTVNKLATLTGWAVTQASENAARA